MKGNQLTTRSIAKEAVAVVNTPANAHVNQFSPTGAIVGKKQLQKYESHMIL